MIKSFDEVFEDVTKLGVKIKTDEYHPIGKYQIIDQGQEAVAGYSDLEDGVFENVPAIVFGDHTRIVKYVDQPFFLGADGVKVLRSRFKDANYRYLYYALKSVKIPNTGYNRHFKWLKEAKIYYPNSEEQSKIVLILDEISSVIEHRQRQLQKLDELVKARFIEMFGDPVDNDRAWATETLNSVCSTIVDCPHSTPSYTSDNTGYMCIRTSIVKKNHIMWDDIEYIPEQEYYQRIQRKRPERGDIIYTREGAILGIAAMIDRECNVALGQRSMLLSPNAYKCLPQFLSAAMNFDSFLRKVLGGVSGSASPHINVGDIKAFAIILPPIELQEQFAAFIEQTDKSKVAIQKALDEAQLLFDSLMQKYFG